MRFKLFSLICLSLILHENVSGQDYTKCLEVSIEIDSFLIGFDEISIGDCISLKKENLKLTSFCQYPHTKVNYIRAATKKEIKKGFAPESNFFIRDEKLFKNERLQTNFGLFVLNQNLSPVYESGQNFDTSQLIENNIKSLPYADAYGEIFKILCINKDYLVLKTDERKFLFLKSTLKNQLNGKKIRDLFKVIDGEVTEKLMQEQLDSFQQFFDTIRGKTFIAKNKRGDNSNIYISSSLANEFEKYKSEIRGIIPLTFLSRKEAIILECKTLKSYKEGNPIWDDSTYFLSFRKESSIKLFDFNCYQDVRISYKLVIESEVQSKQRERQLKLAEKSAREYKPHIHTSRNYIRGSRGGCYYINSSGNKTYIDRNLCN